MADQFVGEIRIFTGNFAPNGWAQCNGQLLSISQNTALFSLLGTSYGGDGRTSFALPNLQGAATVNQGNGAGLSAYGVGATGGQAAVTLSISEMPAHTHTANAVKSGTVADPSNALWADPGTRPAPNFFANNVGTPVVMHPQALTGAGSSSPHNNLMPYQVVNYCIALQGIFPSRP